MIQNRIDEGTISIGQEGKGNSSEEWSLFIGSAVSRNKEKVLLDSSGAHVIFICGARGSGKSYSLGVLAEELARKDSEIAAVIIDPIGVFWSMKYPNQEEEEIEMLEKFGETPQAMENLNVYVPTGYRSEVPEETFDTDFSFKPSSLKAGDWCLTFGIDRYSPQGLLLERAIEKVKEGYTRSLGDKVQGGSRDVPPEENFSIGDIIECMNHDRELTSKDKGFNKSTRRALSSRMTAAKDWGIFGKEKKLSDLIKPGTISVFDISFLSKNIGSLVLGILSRKILAARKAAAREEAVKDLKAGEEKRFGTIPPIWLMVDEAQSFVPASGKTAATDPLIEFVKKGRRPGLSAVLSTQQPSALSSKVISQLDILLSHRLAFDNDIKEVRKRMPTKLPENLKDSASLKRLPEGTAVTADKETEQAFLTSIRPRLSQHEGRERIATTPDSATPDSEGSMEASEPEETDFEEETTPPSAGEISPQSEEVLTMPLKVTMEEAVEIAKEHRKKFLKVFWPQESVERVKTVYYPVWGILIDYYPKGEESVNLQAQVDAISGELVRKMNSGLKRTNGVRDLAELDSSDRKVFFEILRAEKISRNELEGSFENRIGLDTCVDTLVERGLIDTQEDEGVKYLEPTEGIDIPLKLSERSILAAEALPKPEAEYISIDEKIDRIIGEDRALDTVETFGDMEIVKRELFYYPYQVAEMVGQSESRILAIDGIFGKRDEYAERMLRRRAPIDESGT